MVAGEKEETIKGSSLGGPRMSCMIWSLHRLAMFYEGDAPLTMTKHVTSMASAEVQAG